ncbi:hypothetical protein ACG5V6_21430 [Streptomyces chitinivorans]|uniref:DUF3558 domain-containing protein n=1 Tax=Streptomyces chitinivorans TaxID=1257027 RepID=A0ABW7HXY1_9ACTN|nr:hypothetical protein [Streptomyces chitinivorans]MDH2411765.1 hypothetical protein [Streptomyces chitinivorans]
MQRKAYATGAALVAALAVGTVGCTGGSGTGGAAADSKPGTVGTAAATAPPGTYRDLPEPCGAVDTGLLKAMLPGAGSASPEDGAEGGDETPAAYEGEQTVTYDDDRRVGCRWKSSTGMGSRHLLVDFERVVSYDPAVSDDERAVRLYEDMVLEAGIPSSPPADEESPGSGQETDGDGTGDGGEADEAPEESGEPAESDGGDDGVGEDGEDGARDGSGEPGTAVPQPAPGAALAPRPLEDVGDAAYIDDELVTADSGVHRDITLVFRTGNVIVTVEYEQWVTDKRRLPDSAELQEKALKLAGQLAGEFRD